jgi:hypothetical protein
MNWYSIQPGKLLIDTYTTRYTMNWYVENQVNYELVHIWRGTK